MRILPRLTAILLLLAAATASAQDFVTLPEAGKLLGYVGQKEPGGWLVLGPGGFKQVTPTITDGGKAVVWQGDAGEYLVLYFPPVPAGSIIQPLTTTITLGQVTPPTPPPPPDTIPEGKFGLGPKAYRWASAVAAEHRKAAGKLADNFEAVASGMAAGAYKTPKDANQELTGRNRVVLGNDGAPLLEAWRPWFVAWQQEVDGLIAAGRVKVTVEDYQVLYRETVLGLREAAK